MTWKQTEFIHRCPASTAWESEFYYSNLYPPNQTVYAIDTDKNPQNNKDIIYKFNEYGFRSDSYYEFNDINILVNGCSLTVGVGVNENWAEKLKHKIQKYTNLGVNVYNHAISGSSPDYVKRTTYKILSMYRIKQQISSVFVYWPPYARLELPHPDHEKYIWQSFSSDKSFPKLFLNEEYLKLQLLNNKIFLHQLFNVKSITYYENKYDVPFEKYSRDNQHPNEEWHERVAEMFFEQWKTNNNNK